MSSIIIENQLTDKQDFFYSILFASTLKKTKSVSRLCVPTGKTQWQEFSQENSTRYKKAKKEPKADPTERAKDMTVMTVRDKQRHTHRPFLPRVTKRAVV